MGSYRISFEKTPKISKEFWHYRVRTNRLLVNIHGFMQLLCNRYFEVLVDHKAIEYMVKSKTDLKQDLKHFYLNLASIQ